MVYRNEFVKCGKDQCKSCPHGPYWYWYWNEKQESGKWKTRKRYVGKDLPRNFYRGPDDPSAPETARPTPARPHPHDEILRRGCNDIALAIAVLGIPLAITEAEATRAFRKLSLQCHPDRGGDVKTMCRINAAWAILRRYKLWR